MQFVVLFLVLMVIGCISAYVERKCNNNEGANMGERYMKDKWGIDERNEYHE